MNVSSKHWILVFRVKFGQMDICDSLVANGKYPKILLKEYLALQIFTALFFNCVFFKFSSKKNSIDRGIFSIAYLTEILHGEKVKILHSILL